jgi:monoamine oxidase
VFAALVAAQDSGLSVAASRDRVAAEHVLTPAQVQAIEREGLDAAFAFAVEELAQLLGSRIRTRLNCRAGTAWRKAEWIHGSYSHALPGHASSRGMLAAPVDGRLFFAGEATHVTDYSTAHGAWESGVRAAAEALACAALRSK